MLHGFVTVLLFRHRHLVMAEMLPLALSWGSSGLSASGGKFLSPMDNLSLREERKRQTWDWESYQLYFHWTSSVSLEEWDSEYTSWGSVCTTCSWWGLGGKIACLVLPQRASALKFELRDAEGSLIYKHFLKGKRGEKILTLARISFCLQMTWIK